jgi:hypothetical protein
MDKLAMTLAEIVGPTQKEIALASLEEGEVSQ